MMNSLDKLKLILDVRLKVNNAKLAVLMGDSKGAIEIIDTLVKDLDSMEGDNVRGLKAGFSEH